MVFFINIGLTFSKAHASAEMFYLNPFSSFLDNE